MILNACLLRRLEIVYFRSQVTRLDWFKDVLEMWVNTLKEVKDTQGYYRSHLHLFPFLAK